MPIGFLIAGQHGHQDRNIHVVYDNLIYGHREAVKWGHFEYGDLRDTNRLEQVFNTYEIDAVFHFAAFAYVGESVEKPSKYYINNVAATLNLLDVMVRLNIPVLMSMLSGDQETDWQLSRIQEISPK